MGKDVRRELYILIDTIHSTVTMRMPGSLFEPLDRSEVGFHLRLITLRIHDTSPASIWFGKGTEK